MEEKKKHAGGRPTKYDPEMCKILPDMFKSGESITEVCVSLDISRETFYRWMKEHEEFNDAIKMGLEKSEAWWEKLGRAGAVGNTKVSPPIWIFNMKNRFKWSDRNDVTFTGDVSTGEPSIDLDEIIGQVRKELKE